MKYDAVIDTEARTVSINAALTNAETDAIRATLLTGAWVKSTNPLPTTPGSVIRGRTDTAFLTRSGWINQLGGPPFVPDPSAWTVIYDAGAKS